jgi:hypothetical protein
MTIGKTTIWFAGDQVCEDSITRSCILERSGQEQKKLWYRVPARNQADLTDQSDPFVLAAIFLAMRENTDLVIHGNVSRSLLRNLEEFQSAWTCWLPKRYARIEVRADSELESSTTSPPERAIAAFSGGVDSSFTAFRYKTSSGNALRGDLRAAIMVHGFDIPLDQVDTFSRAAERSQSMLDSLKIEFIPVATNFRELKLDWKDCFAAAAASCLSLFQGGYRNGLLGSSEPYSSLVLPWGSNPVTDHLLSSESFRIIHDGAGFTRSEKIAEIARWPEAMRYLRVCWQGQRLDRNCGRCEKCIRTILNFRVNGIPLPESFDQDIGDLDILKIRGLNVPQLAELHQIASAARAAAISASWVRALERCIKRNHRRQRLTSYLPEKTLENLSNALPWRVRALLSR